MLETLVGGVLGGVFRLVPEAIKWLDKKNEREHEIKMFDKQLEADKLRSAQQIAQIQAQGQVALDAAGMDALTAAIKGQSQLSGVKWIDGMNQSVRPAATYLLILLYLAAKTAACIGMLQAGQDWKTILTTAYSDDDRALLSGILNFWFLDRVIRKQQGV
jgi:hypothetical protein